MTYILVCAMILDSSTQNIAMFDETIRKYFKPTNLSIFINQDNNTYICSEYNEYILADFNEVICCMIDIKGVLVNMIYKEKHVDLTDKKIFDDHGNEICKICPWNEKAHHPEVICEAYHCGEAMELFLEKETGFMQIKLKEIRERAEEATPGSREYSEDANKKGVFIAHARQDIIYLLEALQQAQEQLNRTEDEWELQVLKRLTYCASEPNKSLVKINQELKMELQQSRARERVFRETLQNLYL